MDVRARLVGFIGVGRMGEVICRSLQEKGVRLLLYDTRAEVLTPFVKKGARAAESIEAICEQADIVATCLHGDVYKTVAMEKLLPAARPGQIFIDHSTTSAPTARKIAEAFLARGARILDAPVSGSQDGAVYIGGEESDCEALRPYFEAMATPGLIFHGGTHGRGQVLKMMQQLRYRMITLAAMEVLALGLREGLDLETMLDVMLVDAGDDREIYVKLVEYIQAGEDAKIETLFAEWKYYLEEAQAQGIPMPMLEGMYNFCGHVPPNCKDNANRPKVNVWRELLHRKGTVT